MVSNGRNDDGLVSTKRDILIMEHLLERGITSIEEASGELLDAANAYADKILGVGNNN